MVVRLYKGVWVLTSIIFWWETNVLGPLVCHHDFCEITADHLPCLSLIPKHMLPYLNFRSWLPFLHPLLSSTVTTLHQSDTVPTPPHHCQHVFLPRTLHLPFFLIGSSTPATHMTLPLYKSVLPYPRHLLWITLKSWRWDRQVVLKC
jgi:hypothetical protein